MERGRATLATATQPHDDGDDGGGGVDGAVVDEADDAAVPRVPRAAGAVVEQDVVVLELGDGVDVAGGARVAAQRQREEEGAGAEHHGRVGKAVAAVGAWQAEQEAAEEGTALPHHHDRVGDARRRRPRQDHLVAADRRRGRHPGGHPGGGDVANDVVEGEAALEVKVDVDAAIVVQDEVARGVDLQGQGSRGQGSHGQRRCGYNSRHFA